VLVGGDRRGGGRSGDRGGMGGDADNEGGEGGEASYVESERLKAAGGLAMPTRRERGIDFSGDAEITSPVSIGVAISNIF